MLGELLDDLLTSASTGPCITATRHFAPRPPVLVPFPPSLDPRIADALRARGIHELYSHQAQSWELIEKGHHVVVVTPTAPGKTLCYNLPAAVGVTSTTWWPFSIRDRTRTSLNSCAEWSSQPAL